MNQSYQSGTRRRWPFAPRVRRLRPAGHSAWVEAMHQPVLVAISLACTSAAIYVLAKDFIMQEAAAIGAGALLQIIPLAIVLLVIGVTGAAIDITFLTAASRTRMHLLRREWRWALPSGIMLLITLGTEGLTTSYLLYSVEHPALPAGVAAFMLAVPVALFFIRAFAALVCAGYLIIGVLPLILQPQDVQREVAAESGSAMVAIMQRLVRLTADLSVRQCLELFGPVATVFRLAAGHDTAEEDAEMEVAMRALHDRLSMSDTDPIVARQSADDLIAPLVAAAQPLEKWHMAPAPAMVTISNGHRIARGHPDNYTPPGA